MDKMECTIRCHDSPVRIQKFRLQGINSTELSLSLSLPQRGRGMDVGVLWHFMSIINHRQQTIYFGAYFGWCLCVLWRVFRPKLQHQTMDTGTIYFNIRILGMMRDGIWKMNVYFVMPLKVSWRRYNENTVTWRVFILCMSCYMLYVVWKISRIKITLLWQ